MLIALFAACVPTVAETEGVDGVDTDGVDTDGVDTDVNDDDEDDLGLCSIALDCP